MALSRVTTWVAGQVLTAAALNGEFNNVLNNPIALISPTTGIINFNLQAHTNLLPSVISASSGSATQVLTVSGGSAVWAAAAGGSNPGSRVMGLTGQVSSTNTQQITMQANQYLLQTTVSSAPTSTLLNSTDSFTINVGTAGPAANGRDIAGQFASTFCNLFAITTGANSTAAAGIASTRLPSAGPVMPTSYTNFAYLGTYGYSSASSAFSDVRFQNGSWIHWQTRQNLISTASAVTTSEANNSYSSLVPPQGTRVLFNIGTELWTDAVAGRRNTANFILRITSSVDYSYSRIGVSNPGIASTFVNSAANMAILPVTTSGGVLTCLSWISSAGSPTPYAVVDLLGYSVPNGDAA